jgi:hypothetical protein
MNHVQLGKMPDGLDGRQNFGVPNRSAVTGLQRPSNKIPNRKAGGFEKHIVRSEDVREQKDKQANHHADIGQLDKTSRK